MLETSSAGLSHIYAVRSLDRKTRSSLHTFCPSTQKNSLDFRIFHLRILSAMSFSLFGGSDGTDVGSVASSSPSTSTSRSTSHSSSRSTSSSFHTPTATSAPTQPSYQSNTQPTAFIPLTTTFTPPATCTENSLTMLSSPGFFIWANEPVPVPETTFSNCYPSQWLESYTSVPSYSSGSTMIPASSIVPAMSPLVCPDSWSTVLTAGSYVACCPG